MSRTIAVPESLLKKLSRATRAFRQLEDEMEDFLLLSNPEFLAKMRSARASHLSGKTRLLKELKKDLCIDPRTSRESRNTGSVTIASSCGLTTKRDRSPSTASNTADRSTMTSELARLGMVLSQGTGRSCTEATVPRGREPARGGRARH